MDRSSVVLVTGLSGAGKTSSMAVLEDLGFHCIDRLPVNLIDHILDDIHHERDPRYKKLALSVSSLDFKIFFEKFKNSEVALKVLFLDASKEVLLNRYHASNRHHPLLISELASSLDEAIDAEIEEFSKLKTYATIIIDTSTLSFSELKERLRRFFTSEHNSNLSITFVSFTYRHGLPRDADIIFDMRSLKNPTPLEELVGKNGEDNQVYYRQIEDAKTKEYLEKLIAFLDYSFEQYYQQARHHLTVGIGCTNGQFRSVSVVKFLQNYYAKKYKTFKSHRDMKEIHND